jgi:hypothetical protein
MTAMNKYLRPAIGSVSAVAVAVAAALIGIQFAAPEVITSPATTIEVPVIAPISVGDEDAAAGAISEVIGTDTVTAPGTARATLPDDVLDALDTITEADDPALAVTEYNEEEAATSDGDPCAPAVGDPPADCPEGMHSVILALDGVRDLYIAGMAFPPTQEEYQATSSYTLHPWCPAVTLPETRVQFGIFSTIPADFTVTYWPSGLPEYAHTATVRTSDADRAAYTAAQEAGVDIYDLPLQRSCVVLSELALDTAYTVSLSAVDMFGRPATQDSFFNSGGPLGVPWPQISHFGDNVILARALHNADERVATQGILATDEDPSPSCDAAPTAGAVISTSETEVTPEYLLDAGILPEYSHRSNTNFLVPEGSTFVVCFRYYRAADGLPSWETDTPERVSRTVVQAPDFVRPRVTVTSTDVPDGTRLKLGSTTRQGVPCGEEYDSTIPGPSSSIPFVLCEPARVSQNLITADDIVNFDYTGDIIINSRITWPGQDSFVGLNELHLGVQGCHITCPTPETQLFAVLLGPPFSRESPVAQIRVTWEQGRSNGASSWSNSLIETVTPDYVAPELPDFDRNADTDNFQINWEAKNVSFTYELGVDRPVDYTVSLTSESPDFEAACTDSPSPVLTQTGHTDRTATLRFSGLCLGSAYLLDVTLTDAAGHTVRYTVGHGGVYTHIPVLAPGWDGSLVWEVHTTGPARSQLYNFGVSVGGVRVSRVEQRYCSENGVIDFSDFTDVSLAQNMVVTVSGYWFTPDSWSSTSCDGGREAGTVQLWQPVTLDQVQWGSSAQGVWLYGSDLHGTSVHLWMDDFR